MGRIKEFFYKLRFLSKVKYFKRIQKALYSKLSVFQTIYYPEKYVVIQKKLIDLNIYQDLIEKHNDLERLVTQHNNKINLISRQIDDNIEKHSIVEILNNIDAYTLESLREISKVSFDLNNFSLKDSFPKKKEYISYVLSLGDIIDNYQNIKTQFSLIKEIENKTNSLPDKYLDADFKRAFQGFVNDQLYQIKKLGSKYYATPYIDGNIIELHNQKYIERHISDVIFDSLNGVSLDLEQRRAILSDPISNLTIAGAGAGKTLTICGKVKWLIEKCGISPQDILLLSYSKASAEDLDKKVSKISSALTVKTFHSLGLEILNRASGFKMAVEEQFKSYVKRYFDVEINGNTEVGKDMFQFLTLYLYSNVVDEKLYEDDGERYEELKKLDYITLKDRVSARGKDQLETIQKEYVKSYQELVIANWLYINGVNYEYEKSYEVVTSTIEKRQYTPDFYLSDYGIYIEHYGINKYGRAPQYTKAEEEKYLKGIEWKRRIHQNNNTVCIETFSYNFTEGNIFDVLKEELEKNGVELRPLTNEQIQASMNSIFEGRDLTSLMNLVTTFISLYKAQYSDETHFDQLSNNRFESKYETLRARLFLRICKNIYLYYISNLESQGKIDFDDMILKSIGALGKLSDYRYKYIIVDEFQDISQSRKSFLLKLIEHGSSKLFAVGDDWQAIYRFAGCDVEIFLKFKEIFKDAEINYITTTHRNSAELQEIIEPFITANPEQYKKHIQSAKHITKPISIVFHRNNRRRAFLSVLESISEENPAAKVLVLGRNRKDIDSIMGSDEVQVINYDRIICKRFDSMSITYKTVHQSKGLEEDYVILISGENARNGFPNKMEDDRMIEMVLGNSSSFPYAEERRLFYVAITRTRTRVYILSDKNRVSEFVKEIYDHIQIADSELAEDVKDSEKYLCPWCKSGKLVLRESANGDSRFYGCTNYPYCTYSINDFNAIKTNNRCPECNDFLVIRNGKNGKFIGCHNYPRCKYTRQIRDDIHRNSRIGFR